MAIDEFCAETGEFVSLWPDKSGTARSAGLSDLVDPKVQVGLSLAGERADTAKQAVADA
jgi:hypothetical protein